jgi:hypothetical protein
MDISSDDNENKPVRLSEISLNYTFSDYNERLTFLDRISEEIIFHFKMISKNWGLFEFSALGVAVLAIILGSWDIGIGELNSGGNYNRVGTKGILFLDDLSLMLTILSIIAWFGFAVQLFIRFPIMRENVVYMFLGMFTIQVGYLAAHLNAPEFPSNLQIAQLGPVILSNLIFAFLTIFVVHRAVIETRDVHVLERHDHPDPRVVQTAWKDHSLKLWSIGLGLWMILVNVFSWSGAHSISTRPVSADDSVFQFPWLYLICSIISVFLLIHIIWYPQFMLGAAGDRIQSTRAREVSGELNIVSKESIQGMCPICKEDTPVIQHPSGKITINCVQFKCEGTGVPGTICQDCDMTLPTRIECGNCKSNTTITSHFYRQDAW